MAVFDVRLLIRGLLWNLLKENFQSMRFTTILAKLEPALLVLRTSLIIIILPRGMADGRSILVRRVRSSAVTLALIFSKRTIVTDGRRSEIGLWNTCRGTQISPKIAADEPLFPKTFNPWSSQLISASDGSLSSFELAYLGAWATHGRGLAEAAPASSGNLLHAREQLCGMRLR